MNDIKNFGENGIRKLLLCNLALPRAWGAVLVSGNLLKTKKKNVLWEVIEDKKNLYGIFINSVLVFHKDIKQKTCSLH